MKIYLAGKMSGIPYFNFPEFFRRENELRGQGHEIFNPAQADIDDCGFDFSPDCPAGSHAEIERLGIHTITYRDCMRRDLNCLLDWAEAIALIPGWEASAGAKVELALANLLNLEVIHLAA